MTVCSFHKNGLTLLAVGFNRGHCVKLIAKKLEELGRKLEKSDNIDEINVEEENKGEVTVYQDEGYVKLDDLDLCEECWTNAHSDKSTTGKDILADDSLWQDDK